MSKATPAYVEELSAWVNAQKTKQPVRARNSVAFLAVREEVVAAMAHFPLKTIWKHMRATGRLPYRYETFLKHVALHITGSAHAGEAVPAANPPAAALPAPAALPEPVPPSEPRRTDTTVPGFQFTAAADPKELF